MDEVEAKTLSKFIKNDACSQSEQFIKGKVQSYRICNSIDFLPAELLLRNKITGKEVSLFSPASKCLEALIENKGNILSQKELMYIGWESTGTKVTQNAYYQNIANIRRALKDVSEANTDFSFIITTIKRSGLTITTDIEITPINQSELEKNTYQDNLAVSCNIKKEVENSEHRRYTIMLLVTILILTLSWAIYSHIFTKRSLFDGYLFLKHIPDECDVYLNIDANDEILRENPIGKRRIYCEGYSKAYITIYPNHSRSSILLCSTIKGKLICTSHYYASNNN